LETNGSASPSPDHRPLLGQDLLAVFSTVEIEARTSPRQESKDQK